ncbi:ketoacyl-ACP synthase III [bacterium]|nr:ketoacyl-ACP synthase III [bacterium]
MSKQLRAKISGVGSYVPPRVVTNHDLAKFMETSDEWITQRSGIKERRWALPEQMNADMAREASEKAIRQAGIDKSDIGMIIFATLNPDHFFPGNGVFLQEKMGMHGIPALDIRQQCSGFVYGLSVADQYIRTGTHKHILVVGSEIHSRGLDKTTRGRDVTVLFGDGAGAVVVSGTEIANGATDPHIYSTHLHSDGRGAKNLWMPAPGPAMHTEERITHEMLDEGLHYPKMDGKRVFVEAVTRMGEVLIEGLQHNKLNIQDIDVFLFHQANIRINEAVAESLKIPRERVFNTIHKYGNTTAATIPLGMDDALQAGVLKKGMRVAMAAFGSGYTWASAILRY